MASRIPNNRQQIIRPGKPSFSGARGMSRQQMFDHIQSFQKVSPQTTNASTVSALPTELPPTGGGGSRNSVLYLSTATPISETVGIAGSAGISAQASPSDHVHGLTGPFAQVSGTDTMADYLINKLLAGTNITITKTSVNGVETLTIAATGSAPAIAQDGQIQISQGGAWIAATPVVNDQGEIVTDSNGKIVYTTP